MTAPSDHFLLRRRVLWVGVLSFALWVALAWTIAWLEISDAWLLIGTVLLYLLVTRPLMHPVREAIKLRRRLAYEAWLDEKGRKGGDER
ncbi:MAG: hypothetical protein M3P04_14435 [Actinomycetota bacterium]|nr:hypothetical protein [Actinomycetota bacterium]